MANGVIPRRHRQEGVVHIFRPHAVHEHLGAGGERVLRTGELGGMHDQRQPDMVRFVAGGHQQRPGAGPHRIGQLDIPNLDRRRAAARIGAHRSPHGGVILHVK